MSVLEPILWVLFVLACILVSGIILLQDSKGGGLGEAFGGAGAQTFGVDNKGVAKFTAYCAGAVLLLAIVITRINTSATVLDLGDGEVPAGVTDVDGGAAPGGAGTGDAGAGGGDAGGAGAPVAPAGGAGAPAGGGGQTGGDSAGTGGNAGGAGNAGNGGDGEG